MISFQGRLRGCFMISALRNMSLSITYSGALTAILPSMTSANR